ncbi:MAG: hypothetical protein ACOY9Y_10110 [Bacillota bacterium]
MLINITEPEGAVNEEEIKEHIKLFCENRGINPQDLRKHEHIEIRKKLIDELSQYPGLSSRNSRVDGNEQGDGKENDVVERRTKSLRDGFRMPKNKWKRLPSSKVTATMKEADWYKLMLYYPVSSDTKAKRGNSSNENYREVSG